MPTGRKNYHALTYHLYIANWQEKYHLYTTYTYILPIGWLYMLPTYHVLSGVPRFHSIEGPNCWPELPWKNAGLPVTMHLSPWKAFSPQVMARGKKRTPTDHKQWLWTLNIISPYTEGYTRQHAWNCVTFFPLPWTKTQPDDILLELTCWGLKPWEKKGGKVFATRRIYPRTWIGGLMRAWLVFVRPLNMATWFPFQMAEQIAYT